MNSTYMSNPCPCPWPWGGGSGVVKKILVDEKYLHEQSLSLPMTWGGSWSIKKILVDEKYLHEQSLSLPMILGGPGRLRMTSLASWLLATMASFSFTAVCMRRTFAFSLGTQTRGVIEYVAYKVQCTQRSTGSLLTLVNFYCRMRKKGIFILDIFIKNVK